MADDALTVPCEGIGVWEGARGVWRGRPIQIWEPMDGGRWATFHGAPDGGEQVPWFRYEPISTITLDLTHRPTRLEMRLRLAERMGHIGTIAAVVPRDADWWLDMLEVAWSRLDIPALADLDPTDDTRLPDGARVVDVRALAIVLRQAFTPPQPPPPQPR